MLVPLDNVVGTGYNAGLTATAIVQQPDSYAGGGFTSPSGRPIGALKLGADAAYRMVATIQKSRYQQGPPAVAARSEMGYTLKDRRVPYMTEGESKLSGLGEPVSAPNPIDDGSLFSTGNLIVASLGIALWFWGGGRQGAEDTARLWGAKARTYSGRRPR